MNNRFKSSVDPKVSLIAIAAMLVVFFSIAFYVNKALKSDLALTSIQAYDRTLDSK